MPDKINLKLNKESGCVTTMNCWNLKIINKNYLGGGKLQIVHKHFLTIFNFSWGPMHTISDTLCDTSQTY